MDKRIFFLFFVAGLVLVACLVMPYAASSARTMFTVRNEGQQTIVALFVFEKNAKISNIEVLNGSSIEPGSRREFAKPSDCPCIAKAVYPDASVRYAPIDDTKNEAVFIH